jgi:hypothetical protein
VRERGAPVTGAEGEVFAVEARLGGQTLEELALGGLARESDEERERAVREVARAYVAFWRGLHAAGYHDTDVNPWRIVVDAGTGRVRVVGGASVVQAGERVVMRAWTPAFLTPRLFEAASAAQPVAGGIRSMLPALGKLVHFALTGDRPMDGLLPDPGALSGFSAACQQAVREMLWLDEPAPVWGDAGEPVAAIEAWLGVELGGEVRRC